MPLNDSVVTMYNCGPTVYDYVHIGNLRSFLCADLLRRVLEQHGYQVKQVMNITDVGHALADADEGEDKVQVAASKAGKTPQQIAEFYTDAFFGDIDRLGVKRAMQYPRASQHVPEMIAIIEKLLANGHAYTVGQNVYYDVSSFPAYGRLSGNTSEGLQAGARVDVRTEKNNPADFALWIHNPNHLLQWQAPWGSGYPGWHIECSAMSMKYLGETIDIHTGGEDNMFPHHECEIAQSEGATSVQFARFWLHVTHLLVDGEKMAKSKGNFYRLDDLLAKGYSAREVRYLLLATHYRQQLNFTFQALDAARGALTRLDNFVDTLNRYVAEKSGRASTIGAKAMAHIMSALDDDLHTPEALAAVFEFVRVINEKIAVKKLTGRERAVALECVEQVSALFGLTFLQNRDTIPADVQTLIDQREHARQAKQFDESDRLRQEIADCGYVVDDTPEGPRVKKS